MYGKKHKNKKNNNARRRQFLTAKAISTHKQNARGKIGTKRRKTKRKNTEKKTETKTTTNKKKKKVEKNKPNENLKTFRTTKFFTYFHLYANF